MFLTSMFFEENTKIEVDPPKYGSYKIRIDNLHETSTLFVRTKSINNFIQQLENTLNELKSIAFKED